MTQERMSQWINEILEDVQEVPVIGIPGTIIVYGGNASAILSNKDREVIIAAAGYGNGRIVVFSHDGYAGLDKLSMGSPDMEKLYRNIRQWVTKGRFSPNTKIVRDINDKIPHDALVVWSELKDPSDTKYEELLRFVHSGGAMIIAMTPWGFLQLKPEHTLNTLPMNRFVKNAGMCFTEEYFSTDPEESVQVRENGALHSHVLSNLENLENIENVTKQIAEALSYVPLDQMPNGKEQILKCISCWQEATNCCPCSETPAGTEKEKALITLMNHAFDSGILDSYWKNPTVDKFPGDLPANQPVEQVGVTVKKSECGSQCFHPTGYYAPAGRKLLVTINEVPPASGYWSVAIGSHSDKLFSQDDAWRRWPVVQVVRKLDSPRVTIQTHSGGLVYFVSNESTTKPEIQAVLHNVVQAPHYDITDANLKDNWETCRRAPGLWTDLVGEHIMLSVPSSSIRDLDNPEDVVRFWDSVVKTHCWLAGINPSDRRREWVVTDEQPVAGYMHAGYPIVTHLDVAQPDHDGPMDVSLLNASGLNTKGSWGMFHELGHNFQDTMWTFEGTGEVTCNIFTLHAMDVLCGQKPWIHAWLQNSISAAEKYLRNGAKFTEWQSEPGVALFIYAQLARDFGWKAYQEVFKQYQELQPQEKPSQFQEQVDQWISRFSRVVGFNLCPLFELWGFPITTNIKCSLSHLPVHLPKDEMTNVVSHRASQLKKSCSLL